MSDFSSIETAIDNLNLGFPGPLDTLTSPLLIAPNKREMHVEMMHLAMLGVGWRAAKLNDLLQKIQQRLAECDRHRVALINAFSPTSALPFEIMEMIFKTVSSSSHNNDYLRNTRALSHICSSWRSIALSIPSLWTRIDRRAFEGRDECLQQWLGRSLGAKLHVVLLGVWKEPPDPIMKRNLMLFSDSWILSSLGERITCLDIRSTALNSNITLPSLQTLRIINPGYCDSPVDLNVPQLETLHLIRAGEFGQDILEDVPLPNLRRLIMTHDQSPESSWDVFLVQALALETLILSDMDEGAIGGPRELQFWDDYVEGDPLPTSRVTHLELHRGSRRTWLGLARHVTFPDLRSLEITFYALLYSELSDINLLHLDPEVLTSWPHLNRIKLRGTFFAVNLFLHGLVSVLSKNPTALAKLNTIELELGHPFGILLAELRGVEATLSSLITLLSKRRKPSLEVPHVLKRLVVPSTVPSPESLEEWRQCIEEVKLTEYTKWNKLAPEPEDV